MRMEITCVQHRRSARSVFFSFWLAVGLCLGGGFAATARAETAAESGATATAAAVELDRELNEVSAARAELMQDVRERRGKSAEFWRNPKYSSPEIEELRAQLADLERRHLETRNALLRAVEELPEVAAERKRLKADEDRLDTLSERRDALLEIHARQRRAP